MAREFTQRWNSPSGIPGWIATVNSRPLGQRYIITALVFFSFGVLLALGMRSQLAVPDNDFLGPDAYNAIFTMHGSTMLYLLAVPLVEGLGIYLIPMLIGSRDLAFPRLTNFGYWMYLFGGLTMYSSVLFGALPDAGWTAYTPLSGPKHSGIGLDFWLIGLSMVEIAGITAAAEIVVTILKLRAPGMAIQHMPVLVWTYLVAGLMIIFAFTPLLLGTLMLEMDRTLLTQFFNPELGGSSLLWQHLFWWFGHPEVYIIFLPATGIVSALIPVFTRRRLVAYPLVVAAVISTGFVSFGLWSHHMFATGIPDLPMHFFTAASFMIALASGKQIFAWVATLWGSRPQWNVQMLFILGFFFIFVNGGLTGVMVATMSFDLQVHETNFIPAHFHHVLIGGAVFPLLAGLHHWIPKITGRMYSEGWGKAGFALAFVGFNLTFLPMYIMGLHGMRRRVYTFPEEMGVSTLNLISSSGAFLLAAGFALLLLNLAWHSWRGRKAGADPWGSGSLEWSVSSPPPTYGYDRPPVVRDLYPRWGEEKGGDASDVYTSKLQRLAEVFSCRPIGWRATILTDIANAYPKALQYLPGPTHIPFFVAVAFWATAAFILAKSYMTAAFALLVAAALIGRWVSEEQQLPKEEVEWLGARSELPLESNGRLSVGWWGMVSLLAILFTVFGALLFSYFYLRLYSGEWPQFGTALPDLTPALYMYSCLLLGGVAQITGVWARLRSARAGVIASLTAAAALGVFFCVLQIIYLVMLPFRPHGNAYASIFFTLTGALVLIVFTAVLFQVATLIRLLSRSEETSKPRLILWLQNTELFFLFAVFVGMLVFVTVYLSPHFL